jgi:hypothetical protein
MGRRHDRELQEALTRSVLITSITVPPPEVSAAQIRERAEQGGPSRTGLVSTWAAIAVMFVGIVLVCHLSTWR